LGSKITTSYGEKEYEILSQLTGGVLLSGLQNGNSTLKLRQLVLKGPIQITDT
jgi:hypothetical protein